MILNNPNNPINPNNSNNPNNTNNPNHPNHPNHPNNPNLIISMTVAAINGLFSTMPKQTLHAYRGP